MTAETNRLAVEPTVSWRREMVVGRPYLVKVDLRLASGSPEWPYDEEELAFTCMLDGALDFAVEAMEDASVVLHRFGGSYGPAEFVVTPVGTGAGTRSLWLTIVSSYGVPVGNAELKTQVRGPGKEREEPPPSAPEQRVMPSAAVAGEQAAAMLNTISVRISPLLPRSTDYRWSVSFSAGADTDSEAQVASGGPGRLTEIQNDVLRVLAQLSEQAALRETVVVFVVPYEIIDHPFDQWRYGEVALGAWFHVAVCLAVSVEPLRPTLTRRWAEILSRTPPTAASLRVTRSVDVGNIAKTDDVLCVVFDRPFDSARDYRHAADNILYAGVPLALIQRAATGTPRRIPASVMAELERQPTLEVLELVRRLRREAESGPSSDHPGRHLILMWNSPQLVDGPEIPAEVERVCAAAGIEGFSTRPVADQRADAAALREVFEGACRRVGADTADCGYTNSGDKVVLVLPLEANEVLGKFIGGSTERSTASIATVLVRVGSRCAWLWPAVASCKKGVASLPGRSSKPRNCSPLIRGTRSPSPAAGEHPGSNSPSTSRRSANCCAARSSWGRSISNSTRTTRRSRASSGSTPTTMPRMSPESSMRWRLSSRFPSRRGSFCQRSDFLSTPCLLTC